MAAMGRGKVSPNPLVGSVIVHNGIIIGEGYHQKYGESHAEVNAINSVKNEDLFAESTLYVNLEPCSHFGLTPPCSDLIIKKKIPRVVIANRDPNPKVDGGGISKLQNAGIEVITGVLDEEAALLNRYFFSFQTKKRPHIILKWAETADGFMGRTGGSLTDSRQISGPMSQKWLHKFRSKIDGILVGVDTVIKDNPSLTTRLYPGKSPLRFVFDPEDRIPADCAMMQDKNELLILSNLNEKGLGWEKIDIGARSILEAFTELARGRNCLSVMIEGGAKTLSSFIETGLWDEAYILRSDARWNEGLKAPTVETPHDQVDQFEETTLYHYSNPQ